MPNRFTYILVIVSLWIFATACGPKQGGLKTLPTGDEKISAAPSVAVDPATDTLIASTLDASMWKVHFNNCSVAKPVESVAQARATFEGKRDVVVVVSFESGCVARLRVKGQVFVTSEITGTPARSVQGAQSLECSGACAAEECQAASRSDGRVLFHEARRQTLPIGGSLQEVSVVTYMLQPLFKDQRFCSVTLYR